MSPLPEIPKLTAQQVTQQAMSYAIRSGIAITSTYALKQCGRLMKVSANLATSRYLYYLYSRCLVLDKSKIKSNYMGALLTNLRLWMAARRKSWLLCSSD